MKKRPLEIKILASKNGTKDVFIYSSTHVDHDGTITRQLTHAE
jgi:hypothetical protein